MQSTRRATAVSAHHGLLRGAASMPFHPPLRRRARSLHSEPSACDTIPGSHFPRPPLGRAGQVSILLITGPVSGEARLHFRPKRFDVRQRPSGGKTPVTITHPLPGIDLSHYLLEPIRGRQDGAFVVLRGHRTAPSGHPASVLVVMPTEEHPRADCVQMLEHEYALRADLDASWAVLPLALANYQGRTCLVLDAPGGELLARTLGTPMDIGLFLRLGVSLAVALS